MFKDLNIVIGVSGGIAAYKVCGMINYLKSEGANIDVIMTENACQFITPLTLEILSNNRVIVDMFENLDSIEVKHINLAQKADLFLVMPATANIIGKVASGIADDMLSTTIMATPAPVVFAPAMNNVMYENPIVQSNIEKLKQYGYELVGPTVGHLACGCFAKGKLAGDEEIVDCVKKLVRRKNK